MAAAKRQRLLPMPKTAYDLMEEVAAGIEAQPHHYYQELWVCKNEDFDPEDKEVTKGMREACGTSFCRAGHMVSVLDQNVRRTADEWNIMHSQIQARASLLLKRAGVSEEAIVRLFNGNAIKAESGLWSSEMPKPGTKRYAKLGAAGVRDFMHTWEHQLKSYKLQKGVDYD